MIINTVKRIFVNISYSENLIDIITKAKGYDDYFLHVLKKFFYICITLGFGKDIDVERSKRRTDQIIKFLGACDKLSLEKPIVLFQYGGKNYRIWYNTSNNLVLFEEKLPKIGKLISIATFKNFYQFKKLVELWVEQKNSI